MIVGIALTLCLTPVILLVLALSSGTAHVLALAQALTPVIAGPWSPLALFVRLFMEAGGLHTHLIASQTGVGTTSEIGILLGLLAVLWIVCVGAARRGLQAGWESLQTAPGSFRAGFSGRMVAGALKGGLFWELAWTIPAISSTWKGFIGLSWQDARYDWKRLSSIIVSAALIALAFVRVSFVGVFASSTILTVVMSVDALFLRAVGLPVLRRVFLTRPLLRVAPLSISDVLGSCMLAAALPVLLLNCLLCICAFLFVHLELGLTLLTVGCILIGGEILSITSVAVGAFAIDEHMGGAGVRASALAFFAGSLSIFVCVETLVGQAAFRAMPPDQQRIVIRLLTALFHVDMASLNGNAVLMSLLGVAGLLVSSLLVNGWWRVRKALQ